VRSVLAVVLAVVGGAVTVQLVRWWPVYRNVARYRRYWLRRAEEPGELRYVALGDSLTQGIGASRPERGYVGLIADALAQRTGRTVGVVNLSITGVRLADLVACQLDAVARLQPDLVTVAVGANDAGRTDPAAFRADFATLCAGLPAGSLVADVPDFQGGGRRTAAAALSAVAREVLAAHPALVPVPLEAATVAMTFRDYADDFFHPSDAGHARYAAPFLRALPG